MSGEPGSVLEEGGGIIEEKHVITGGRREHNPAHCLIDIYILMWAGLDQFAASGGRKVPVVLAVTP